MADDFHKRIVERSEPEAFRKTLGLFSATTLGVGALMGAGLYVLVGIAAQAAGPGMWIAYAVCGLLTSLSVLMFADFARRMPVSGGGYVYAYRQLGSFWGFMVGWHLAVGSIFACALYAFGFGSYALSFFPGLGGDGWIKGLAIGVVMLLTAVGLRGSEGGSRLQGILTWGNLAVIVVLVAVAVPLWSNARFEPMLPRGMGGVGAAISLVYISFFGYQLIANSAEEVRDAPRTVPRAMILALAVAAVCYLVVAVVAVAAVDWQELAGSDAPLVLMASRAVGDWGAWLIGAGAILASAAALNSTLVSQGRQVYAMGRDRLLPEMVGRLTERTKVPAVAMVSASLLVVSILALADLAFIAKAANFALLFSMLPVSVALARLHRDQPQDVSRWRRVVPWAALAANTGLLLTLDWQSLMFGGLVVGAGAVVFLSYSYSAEKRGRAGFSVDLARDRNPAMLRRGERILVPMANPRTQESLFSISEALMPPDGGEIVVLNVVQSEPDEDPRTVLRRMTGSHEAVSVLQRVRETASRRGVTFKPVVRAAKTLAKGIAHSALRQRCRLIVMGWASQDDGAPSKLLDEVVSEARTDVIFLQLTADVAPRRIGVALGARGNLPLMVRVASTLAEKYEGEVIYLNVLPEYYGPEHHEHARQVHAEAIRRHTSLVPYRTELLQSDNPLGALVERSRELDLLVVGSARSGPYAQEAVGTFSAMVAQQAHSSVVIVRSSPSMGRLWRPPALEALRDLGASFWPRREPNGEVEAVVGPEATVETEDADPPPGDR